MSDVSHLVRNALGVVNLPRELRNRKLTQTGFSRLLRPAADHANLWCGLHHLPFQSKFLALMQLRIKQIERELERRARMRGELR